MANVETTNLENFNASPRVSPPTAEWDGKVRNKSDVYEASALETGSTISFGDLPRGAVIRNVQVWTDNLGVGTSIVVKIGSTTFLTVTTTSAAYADLNDAADIDLVGTKLSADSALTIDTTGEATGTIKVAVEYAAEN